MIGNLFKKNKKINYEDVIGKKTSWNNPSYGKGEKALLGFEKVIKNQLETSIKYGIESYLANSCKLAASGKPQKAVRKIKKLTELQNYEEGQIRTIDVSKNIYDLDEFYKYGFRHHDGYGEAWTGEHSDYLYYIDACLFGARISELNKDYKNAKILYGRAKKIINDRIDWTAGVFSGQCKERNYAWKKAMKRMYKAGAFN
jgi:hypothetical protein